jgi:hypothetical protein
VISSYIHVAHDRPKNAIFCGAVINPGIKNKVKKMLQERLRKQDRYQLKFQACVKMQHNRQFPRSHADTFAKMMFFPVSFSKSCLQGSKICICILLDTYNAFHEYNYIIHIN